MPGGEPHAWRRASCLEDAFPVAIAYGPDAGGRFGRELITVALVPLCFVQNREQLLRARKATHRVLRLPELVAQLGLGAVQLSEVPHELLVSQGSEQRRSAELLHQARNERQLRLRLVDRFQSLRVARFASQPCNSR